MQNRKPSTIAAPIDLCACCKFVSHDFVIDRDLDAYVCRDCGNQLASAVQELTKAGLFSCIKQG